MRKRIRDWKMDLNRGAHRQTASIVQFVLEVLRLRPLARSRSRIRRAIFWPRRGGRARGAESARVEPPNFPVLTPRIGRSSCWRSRSLGCSLQGDVATLAQITLTSEPLSQRASIQMGNPFSRMFKFFSSRGGLSQGS